MRAVRRIQCTTVTGVLLLAGIAAVVSFRHMHELCLRHREDQLAAVLIPLAVDGAIVVASMSILLANRYGCRGGFLAWAMLLVGSLASLGANIAVAEPSVIGRIIAAWPSVALIGSYELLMSQLRRASGRKSAVVQDEVPGDLDLISGNDHDSSEQAGPHECGTGDLRRTAWQWALANRLPDGALPSGRAIAEQFARSARWGRWIKRRGMEGKLAEQDHSAAA
ncbi:DUF2637 domain-containing protein [Sphaerisporangium sp. TRM90804]|uniref:DUF2637 domain-containing protein n=1 Tax=Sphaerisporangium sp. TRM90804 TaxID=3031113 RepID=UPI002449CC68|nr:DUF2637 domain-containing protein [Sphaerisporangium sp. TRM90804]MDH2426447.1 DUF2637 domain-containing protein [Sphaerisporangium sp. TRM90804]